VKRLTPTIAALLSATFLAAAAEAQTFKVGTILPLTGPGADIGRTIVEGAKAAVALANARGGIAGMKTDIIICDTQSVEQQAVLCARRLLSEDKVNLLLGAGTTPQTLAILPTVDAAQVPMFAIAGAVVNFRPLKKWSFKSLATIEDQIPVALDELKRRGITKIASIRDNGPFGTDVAENLKIYAAKAGIEIVADELYAPSDTDMTAQVTRVRALRPQAIFDFSSNPPPGALVAKKIAQLGITVPIVVGQNLQTKVFANLAGDASDQILYIGSKAAMASVPDSDPLAANIRDFRAQFKKLTPDVEIVTLSAVASDAVLLTQAAAKSLGAKAFDGNALREALESLKDVPGVQGIWSFSPTSHESNLKDGVALLKFVKGEWHPAQ
jgi:branched-chain amino acid transport system substrate-binding protein